MSGNVWEWTRSLWGENWDKPEYGYPYDPQDGREDLEAPNRVLRVLRGGSFYSNENYVRCAARARVNPNNRDRGYGFRVCASPRSTL